MQSFAVPVEADFHRPPSIVLFPGAGTDDTKMIQRAVDACSESGGGLVVLTAGRYRSGTILLKRGVTLHLEKDAALEAGAEGLLCPGGRNHAAVTGEGAVNGSAPQPIARRAP